MTPPKIPISVLVVIHTAQGEVLLLERAGPDGQGSGLWQSVTGSLDALDEAPRAACIREVFEETGLVVGSADCPESALIDWQHSEEYEIFERWRHRYAPGVTRNTEHAFGLKLPRRLPIALAPREHVRYQWLPAAQAAPLCFSPSNARAIERLAGPAAT
ncbi:dihydroneopterin triphosphate diphosphatase [Amphibiibacter pelophylacis]|uniref:Dihydroneopterin triphosphate diphosphatase n=1 Tax=Amphibiibacter pelophylacis TaxID=1799477 RepID=A0ACC6P2D4_9BURK